MYEPTAILFMHGQLFHSKYFLEEYPYRQICDHELVWWGGGRDDKRTGIWEMEIEEINFM